MLKYILLITMFIVISMNSVAQKTSISGNWILNATLSEFNGAPRYVADSTVTIEQRADSITFKRTFYHPKEIVIEKIRLKHSMSIPRSDNSTKLIEMSYSESERCYIMKTRYSKPGQSEILDFEFTHKWSVDSNGMLIRWLISPNEYEAKLVYDRVVE